MVNWEILDEKRTKEMLELFKGERSGWVQVGQKKYLLPYRYTEQGQGFYEFKFRKSDVVVMSYPRSGTTWTQELVWLIANDLDFKTAKSTPLVSRFPFLEFSLFNHPEVTEELVELHKGNPEKQRFCRSLGKPGYETLSQLPDPRFIKTHLPISLFADILTSGCKIVYVARNPKDVAVSWYYQNKYFRTQGFVGDFKTFWQYFKNDLTNWSPYWEHLKEAWEARNHPNVLFLFYEEMYKDITSAIKRVSNFFNKSYTEDQIAQLADHLHITNFKANPMINQDDLVDAGIVYKKGAFVRNGVYGNWKETFTPELEAEADEWIAKNLEIVDIKFPLFSQTNGHS